MNTSVEARVAELGLELPLPPKPGAIYKPLVVVDKLVFVSGVVSFRNDGTKIAGKVGRDLSTEEGLQAARQTGLNMLSLLQSQLGSLDRIKRLVKTLGMVNCLPDYEECASVVNGFSQLMADVFGTENGIGARSAVGMSLPLNFAVEIEAIFELR